MLLNPGKQSKNQISYKLEYYNNILCVSLPELLDNEVFSSYKAYDRHREKHPYIVVRPGKGKGMYALISYDTLPREKQELIKANIFAGQDPYKVIKHNIFTDYIKPNQIARDFYKTYLYDNGKPIVEEKQTEYYTNAIILSAVNVIVKDRTVMRKKLGGSASGIWENISNTVNNLDKSTYPHRLPKNHDYLRKHAARFEKEGFAYLISGNDNNKNAEKINDKAKIWLLALWANNIERYANEEQLLKEYNNKASEEGWKQLKSTLSLHNFLYNEEIKPLWWGYRYGELKAKEKFCYQHSTKLPTLRDSLWFSDGTKMNYFYQNSDGKMETCEVYEIIDSFSECLLGYNISKSEDYTAQYRAYKMAIQFAGHKPYEIKYDNQGGHKKLENGNFLKRLAHVGINTAPYNGKSKTIENAFFRLQSEFLKKDWFFTGQNIQTKRNESKANLEHIMANKSNLPTLDEVKAVYARRREEWNNATHPKTGVPRIEMYRNSHNPHSHKIEIWDMVDMFWITREKTVMCSAYGITFQEQKQEYTYMVNTIDNLPDVGWIRNNIDKDLTIKFDPDDMSMVYLYEKTTTGLRFLKEAYTKIEPHRGIQEQEEWESSFFKYIEAENKRVRIESRDKVDAILETYNLLPEQHGLNSPTLKGIENRRKRKKTDIAKVQKAMSNATALDDSEEDNIYKLI